MSPYAQMYNLPREGHRCCHTSNLINLPAKASLDKAIKKIPLGKEIPIDASKENMAPLAATQIPKPADEQAFERASIPLWCSLLNDPAVQRNARRGQAQDGVDLYGMRDRNPQHYVGIQCKLKGDGKNLTEREVREEVKKALKFSPALTEYFITTTSPDDGALHELARNITTELHKIGRNMFVYIWGWNTLEEKISESDKARKAFDPSFGPFSQEISDNIGLLLLESKQNNSGISQLQEIVTTLQASAVVLPGNSTNAASLLEPHIDAEIDTYGELLRNGKPIEALSMLEKLHSRTIETASGRILFRIKANIGLCHHCLGNDELSSQLLLEAYDHAPEEPKAISNKAFALLLRGEWEEVLSIGAVGLQADPTNEWLAGYMLQAARHAPSITEPLGLIPEELHNKLAIVIGRLVFLRMRGTQAEWWVAAKEASVLFPDDPTINQYCAEANIDAVVSGESFRKSWKLSDDEREQLKKAASDLISHWNRIRNGEDAIRLEHAAICSNIIVALRVLDENQQALAVARQGLDAAPNDQAIIIRALEVAIEESSHALADELLPKITGDTERTVFGFRLYSSRSDWGSLAKLYETSALHFPEAEKPIMHAAGMLAQLKISEEPLSEEKVSHIAALFKANLRASIFVADFARAEGFDAVADSAFETGLSLLNNDSHIVDRLVAASHADKKQDWTTVADLLVGRIAILHETHDLYMLTRALANESPIRARAVNFFESLPAGLRVQPFFMSAESIFRFKAGHMGEAEELFRKLIATQSDVANYLYLFTILGRSDRNDDIKEILAEIDTNKLNGTPANMILLAQIMRTHGQRQKAMAYAYEVLRTSKNDPDTVMKYFGLIVAGGHDEDLIPKQETVGIDCGISIEDEQGSVRSYIIESTGERPADGIISPTHPLAQAAYGKRAGETFITLTKAAQERRWKLLTVKHKYLHVLHESIESFEDNFPDENGFYQIRLKANDIQPIFDQIKQVSEANRRIADLYLENNFPLNMAAHRLGGNSVRFSEYIRSLGFEIQTCEGTSIERIRSSELIASSKDKGGVLDTYTAWTAATMDILDTLKSIFGSLLVPLSTINELKSLRDSYISNGQPQMTLAWHDGKFIRQESSPEETDRNHAFISEQISKIESICTVKPAAMPDSLDEQLYRLVDVLNPYIFDAASLASEGHILISEDLYFRKFVEPTFGIGGAWIQSALSFALERNIIKKHEYVGALIKLAWRKHAHLSLIGQDLVDALELEEDEQLANLGALLNFIGTKNADLQSHLHTAADFLREIWSSDRENSLKNQKATSLLLSALIRFNNMNWQFSLPYLWMVVPGQFRSYLDEWVRGHFLPMSVYEEGKSRMIRLAAKRLAKR